MDSKDVSIMTVEELAEWLGQEGIPDKFCDTFKDNYIDGKVFLELNEVEIKEMVPPIGLAKKIIKLVPKLNTIEHSSPPLRHFSPPPVHSPSWPSCSSPISDDQMSLNSSVSCTSSTTDIIIPDHWKADTQSCLDSKLLNSNARNDISRTMVTLLTAKYGHNFKRIHVEDTARKLIRKYPFAADDGGGTASWVEKVIECSRNRMKTARKKAKNQEGSTPKKRRIVSKRDDLLLRYPNILHDNPDDTVSISMHKARIKEEMEKNRPSDSIMIPLMKSTFNERRMFIQEEAISVCGILLEYPALVRPSIIEHEIDLMLGHENTGSSFQQEWTLYVSAILQYGHNSGKKVMKQLLSAIVESDNNSRQVIALKLLVEAMASTKQVKGLDYIYKEYEITQTPESVCTQPQVCNSPRIAAFCGEEAIQYFVLVEQRVLCQVPSLQLTLFVTFSSYYVFHLEYPKAIYNVLLFFQDYILGFPDRLKRPGNYLAVASDIKSNKK